MFLSFNNFLLGEINQQQRFYWIENTFDFKMQNILR